MRVGDFPTPEEPIVEVPVKGMDTAAVIDSELLALQVWELFDEKHPVPDILRPPMKELVKMIVECTLEVMTEQLGIGHRLS